MITEAQLKRSNELIEKIKDLENIIRDIRGKYVNNRIGLIKFYPERGDAGKEVHDSNGFFYREFKEFVQDMNDKLKIECQIKIGVYQAELNRIIYKD